MGAMLYMCVLTAQSAWKWTSNSQSCSTRLEWYIPTGGTFPHPNHAVRCGKNPLPLLLEKYPVAIDDIIQFGVKNLTTLTVELFHGFCHEILLPKLFEQWRSDLSCSCESSNEEQDSSLLTKQAFMNEHRIRMLSIPTCWDGYTVSDLVQISAKRVLCRWAWMQWCCGIPKGFLWD